MRPTRKALAVLALSLALATATTAVAAATPPTGTQDQADQRKALYQSELDATLARHRALGAIAEPGLAAQRKAPYESELERTLARHRALGAIAAQPAARTDPARTTVVPMSGLLRASWKRFIAFGHP